MPALLNVSDTQAAELSQLVDLEARWENLRAEGADKSEKEGAFTKLQQKQKAYEAFHTKLKDYNKVFRPPHVPELLLNTPHRLREWCRKMRDLHARVERNDTLPYPANLMEKAYRSAERVASRVNQESVARPTASRNASEVAQELESLACWCDNVAAAQD
jgi:hypothetical protein